MEQYVVKVITGEPAKALLALRTADKLWQVAWDEEGLIVNAPAPYFESVNHLMYSVGSLIRHSGVSGHVEPVHMWYNS